MKKVFLLVLSIALLPALAHAQAAILPGGAAPAAPAPAVTTESTPATAIARAPETPAANPNAIKVKAESVTGKLTVKTDNPGPTRIEVTDVGGRPVLTYTMMNGQTPAVLNVSQLPAGAYLVRCTAHDKTGMRRVMIGQ